MVSVLKVRRLSAKRKKYNAIEDLDGGNLSMVYTDDNAKDDIEFLRTVAVNDTNMPIIEDKLTLTLKYRADIVCADKRPSLLERFPYFFTHPTLVSDLNDLETSIYHDIVLIPFVKLQIEFDFNLLHDIDTTTFFEMWLKCKDKIEPALSSYGSSEDFYTAFDTEVEQLLMLLKLLPLRQHGRTSARNRLNFNQAIEKLVVFCEVNCLSVR